MRFRSGCPLMFGLASSSRATWQPVRFSRSSKYANGSEIPKGNSTNRNDQQEGCADASGQDRGTAVTTGPPIVTSRHGLALAFPVFPSTWTCPCCAVDCAIIINSLGACAHSSNSNIMPEMSAVVKLTGSLRLTSASFSSRTNVSESVLPNYSIVKHRNPATVRSCANAGSRLRSFPGIGRHFMTKDQVLR